MKIFQKVLLILVIAIFSFAIMPNCVTLAAGDAISALDGVEAEAPTDGTSDLTSVVNRVLGFLQIASALIAVIVIAVTGFRYIIETPEMKTEIKKNMVPIAVGILLVFFATSIAKFFIGIFSGK